MTRPLNLECDVLVSKFAFKWVNLYRYIPATNAAISMYIVAAVVAGDVGVQHLIITDVDFSAKVAKAGLYKLNPVDP
jgi:hypothetical protein